MATIRRLTPAQALREANERAALDALRRAVAPDLARLIAALPGKAPTGSQADR